MCACILGPKKLHRFISQIPALGPNSAALGVSCSCNPRNYAMYLHVGTKPRLNLGDPDPPNCVIYSVFAWLWDQSRVNLLDFFGQMWTCAATFCVSIILFVRLFRNQKGKQFHLTTPCLGTELRLSFGILLHQTGRFLVICMILEPNPDSLLGSWCSKPRHLQYICMTLGPNPR